MFGHLEKVMLMAKLVRKERARKEARTKFVSKWTSVSKE